MLGASLQRFLFTALMAIAARSLHAVTITTSYVTAGQSIPGIGAATDPAANSRGGGELQTIVRAAADAWERAIRDDFTVNLHFGWGSTGDVSGTAYHQGLTVGGTPARETAGSLVFNNSPTRPFFLDPTPYENDEFGPLIVAQSELGGGPINSLREYRPIDDIAVGAVDLLSTAIHEIGHAMGLTGWPFYAAETSNGAINVAFGPYAGTAIPVTGSHIDIKGPSLSGVARPVGYRRTITDVDLMAVSQISQFRELVFPPLADFNGDWVVDNFDLISWSDAFNGTAQGDADGNGVTDGADFLIWQRQLGSSSIGNAPEPTGYVLALAAFMAPLASRRLRRPCRPGASRRGASLSGHRGKLS